MIDVKVVRGKGYFVHRMGNCLRMDSQLDGKET
jgi:hypothetical protein